MNETCNKENVKWSYRKEAYGFFFWFYRNNPNKKVMKTYNESKLLSKVEKDVFSLLKKDPKLTAANLALEIHKSERTVKRAIKELNNNRYIERIGSNKNGYWKIL